MCLMCRIAYKQNATDNHIPGSMSRDVGNIICGTGFTVHMCNSKLHVADFKQNNKEKIHVCTCKTIYNCNILKPN